MGERYADPFVRWSTGARAFLVALVVASVPLALLVSPVVGVPAALAVAGWFGWLGSQVSVEADERGLVVRDLLRVTRIPWSDVADVGVLPTYHREYGWQPFGTIVYAGVRRRRDGSVVRLGAMPLWDDERGRRHWGAVLRWQARARLPG